MCSSLPGKATAPNLDLDRLETRRFHVGKEVSPAVTEFSVEPKLGRPPICGRIPAGRSNRSRRVCLISTSYIYMRSQSSRLEKENLTTTTYRSTQYISLETSTGDRRLCV